MASAFASERVFRIDHYLGKEAVEGLYVFRFANRLFEPLWNNEYIDNIQVTIAEGFGTQGRAGFYDTVGAIRDVLQNHILQVVALIAMEAPAAEDAEAFREAEAGCCGRSRRWRRRPRSVGSTPATATSRAWRRTRTRRRSCRPG